MQIILYSCAYIKSVLIEKWNLYSRDITNRMRGQRGHCGDTNHNPPAVPIVRVYWTDIRKIERDGELLSRLRL